MKHSSGEYNGKLSRPLPVHGQVMAVGTDSNDNFSLYGALRSQGRFPHTFSESLLIFPASGNLNSGSGGFNNVGSNGNYWSCSPNNATNGYNLNFNSGNVNPSNNNNRAYGFPVRCVQAFA